MSSQEAENSATGDAPDPETPDAPAVEGESAMPDAETSSAETPGPEGDPGEVTRPERESAAGLTVVGLGAAEGGPEALEEFFAGVTPTEARAAFLVQMRPGSEADGRLVETMRRATDLPVQLVTEPVQAEAGHIYVLPPQGRLAVEEGGVLSLAAPEPLPQALTDAALGTIDLFFRALAAGFGPQASGVVLSGAGGDGALGLGHIKEVGGLTVAQSPGEARHAAMPRHAIAAGRVDFVLPARDIAPQIAQYWDTSRRMRMPSDAAPSPRQRDDGPAAERAFRAILQSLDEQTGHDFAQYKRATVLRRIGRRLQMNNLEDLPTYMAFLRRNPAEAGALLQDLLISVTHFFRDREAWNALERDVVPRLFAGKGPNDEVRAWVCGCATGEEAYSLAMLLLEQAARRERAPRVQVFATDLDARAIALAREAVYPDGIAADVSAGRLQRWFHARDGHYQVRQELRETVLFAVHDALKDTPFSRLDLVTCRNLLIYIERPAQTRMLDLFHFALRPEGLLLLGPSESVDDASVLFGPMDKRHRIYLRRAASRPVPVLSPMRATARPEPMSAAPKPEPGPGDSLVPAPRPADRHQSLLLSLFAPPSVLIGPDRQVLHLSGGANRFLRFGEGVPTLDLLQVVTPDLRMDLTTALYAAESQGGEQRRGPTEALLEDGSRRSVAVTVRPVQEPEEMRGARLVLFEEAPADPAAPGPGADLTAPLADADRVRRLEQIVAHVQAQLRSTVEQYEASVEELMASNEEQQAVNEELRSVTQELETGREEMQSLNEELRTVNQELKIRVDEVSRANSDLQNLLSSTDVGTIFVGRDLQVMRYTRAAESIFNVIAGDVGRPLAHLPHRLDYDTGRLIADAQDVLRRLIPIERQVQSADGRAFLMRLLPYRTLDDRIDGVVFTFLDITDRRRAEQAVRESEEKFRTLFESMDEGYCIIQMLYDRGDRPVDWRYLAVNPAFEKHSGLTNAAGRTVCDLVPDIEPKWMEIYGRVAETGESLRVEEGSPALGGRILDLYAFRIGPPDERRVAVLFTDITARRQNERQQAVLLKLNDVLRPLSDAVEIQAAVAGVAMDDFGADRCYYCEIEDGRAIIRRDAARGGLPSLAGVYPLDDFPLLRTIMNEGAPLVVDDANTTDLMDAELKQLCVQMKIISFINVPVIKAGRYAGNLCITQSAPRDWADYEVDLAREITERTWSAVERARAEEATEADLRDTQILQELSARLVSKENVETLYGEILTAAIRLTRADAGTVQIYDADAKELVLLATSGFGREATDYFHRVSADSRTSCGLVLKTGERVFVDFGPDDADKECRLHVESGYLSAQSTPLIARSGERIGMLSTHWRESKHRPTERELRFLDLLTRQAADLVEQRQAEEKLRLAAELDAFRVRLSDVLRPLADPLVTQQAALRLAAEQLDLDRLLYNEIDADVTTYTVRACYVREGFAAYGGEQPLGPFTESVRALQQGITKVVYDVETDESFSPEEKAVCADIQVRAFVTVPLLKDGRWVLNLVAHSSKPRPWTPHEVNLLEETAERTWAAVERAVAEAALREIQARLQLALNAADLGTFSWYVAEDRTTADARALAHFGFPPDAEATLSESLARTFHPEDGPRYVEAIGRAIDPAGSGTLHQQFRIRRADGERWMSVTAVTVFEGSPPAATRITGVLADITESKRAEDALRASEARLQAMAANLPGGAFIVDRDLRYLLAGGEAMRAAGLVPPDLIGRTIFEALSPDLVAGYEPPLRRALAGEDFTQEHEAHGTTFLSRGTPLRSADGDIYAVLVVSYDISQRKRAEAALLESERRFRTLSDVVPQVIWTNDAGGKADYFNQGWYDYTGLGYGESAGPGWQAVAHPEDAPASGARWEQCLATGEVFDTEYRLRRRDGAYRWFLGRNVPLRDPQGRVTGWFGSATDIEEIKQAEEAIRQVNEALREANDALARSNETLEGRAAERTVQVQDLLRQLVGVQEAERARLARELHDQFGQRITGFMLGINALEAGLPGESEAAALARSLREAAAGLSHEVHQLAWSLRPPALDDMGLAAALSTYVREWGARQGVAADFDSGNVDEGRRLPAEVETALYRIAQEALANVARHAAGASRVSVLLERRDGQARLVIEDDGAGFDLEAAERSERLGLRGMRERAALLGGALEVESSPGEGATLFVRIPLAPGGKEGHV